MTTTYIFIRLLFAANTEPKEWKDESIDRGAFATKQAKLASELYLSVNVLKKYLKRLCDAGKIRTNINHGWLIITIVNYDQYQFGYIKPGETKEQAAKRNFGPKTVFNLWNQMLGDKLPKVLRMTFERTQKVNSRIVEFSEYGGDPQEVAVKLFNRIGESDFLCGAGVHRSVDHLGWKASFDWVFQNGTNWVKIMEGRYDNRERVETAPSIEDVEEQRKRQDEAFLEAKNKATRCTTTYNYPTYLYRQPTTSKDK